MSRLTAWITLLSCAPVLCSACADTDSGPVPRAVATRVAQAESATDTDETPDGFRTDAATTQTDRWSDAVRIGTASGERNSGSSLATNAAGQQLVVWLDWDGDPGSTLSVWARHFDSQAGAWGDPALLEDGPGNAYGVSTAMDRKGNAYAAWTQQAELGGSQTWVRRFDAKTRAWQPPMPLGTDAVQSMAWLLDVDRRGRPLAVWLQQDSAGQHSLWASRLDSSSLAFQPGRLIRSAATIWSISAARNLAGSAVVAWKERSETDQDFTGHCWARRFDGRQEVWLDPDAIADTAADELAVAVGRTGDAMVVWKQRAADDRTFHIWAQAHDARGDTWLEPMPVEQNAPSAHAPAIALDRRGNALVLWRQEGENPLSQSLWANRFDARAGVFGDAEPVGDPNEPRYIFGFSLDLDRSGNALVAWDGLNPAAPQPTSDVLVSSFNARAGTWTAPHLLREGAALPEVALHGRGRATATWHEPPGDGTSVIWASRLASSER